MQRAFASASISAALLFVSACFDAPERPVQFRCDLQTAPSCPDGYTCQPDGCCHRDDLDPAENWNACSFAGPGATTTGTTTDTSGTTTATTDTATTTGEPMSDASSTAPSESSSGSPEEGSSGDPAGTDGAQ